jgi:uncharacterized cupredoxin-like copper-binding protein
VAAAACTGSGSPATPGAPAAAAPVATATAVPSISPVATPVAVLAKVIAPTLSLYEWKVVAAETMRAGPSTFTISNFGTMPHELLIFKSDLAPAAYPKDKSGDIIEDGPGVNLVSDGENIDPGGAQVRTVNLKPGTYLFVCNIPGHFKQGMYQVVTVTK